MLDYRKSRGLYELLSSECEGAHQLTQEQPPVARPVPLEGLEMVLVERMARKDGRFSLAALFVTKVLRLTDIRPLCREHLLAQPPRPPECAP